MTVELPDVVMRCAWKYRRLGEEVIGAYGDAIHSSLVYIFVVARVFDCTVGLLSFSHFLLLIFCIHCRKYFLPSTFPWTLSHLSGIQGLWYSME